MENICDYKNCKKIGQYKAPIEKDNSKKFRWLCLEHIKEFNKKWDYFTGMSEKQISEFIKSDMTWHKPTQSFGSSDNFFNILWNNVLRDQEGIFAHPKIKKQNFKIKSFNEKDINAFKIMELKVGSKWLEIQKQFKMLVKKFHPDMNSGNKIFEDKLKSITLAYNQLKTTYRENN